MYVLQIDDPSYEICKELTDVLNPTDEKEDSFAKYTYHFKEMLAQVEMQHGFIVGSLDIVGMFPNIPV